MREICTHGSEGGAGQTNASSLPLSSPALGMTTPCAGAIDPAGVIAASARAGMGVECLPVEGGLR